MKGVARRMQWFLIVDPPIVANLIIGPLLGGSMWIGKVECSLVLYPVNRASIALNVNAKGDIGSKPFEKIDGVVFIPLRLHVRKHLIQCIGTAISTNVVLWSNTRRQ